MESPEFQFRQEQGEKVIEFLKRINAFEFFQKLANNPEKVREIKFDDLNDFLVRLNGIARNIPIHKREADGEKVYFEGFIDRALVPRQEDKEPLLEEAFDARQDLQNPEDFSYMLPAVTNAVHLFADGNGRTSRMLNILLTPHTSQEEFENKLNKALGEHGRFESLDVNPAFLNVDIENIVLKRHGLKFKEGTESPLLPDGLVRLFTLEDVQSEKAKEFNGKREIDPRICFIAAYNYLKTHNLLDKVIATNEDFPEITVENYKALSWGKMDHILTEDDWQNILDDYYAIKRESVEVLIDIFIHPDEYKNIEGITLRDLFIQKVLGQYSKNKQ